LIGTPGVTRSDDDCPRSNGGNEGGGDVGGDARNDENDGPRADAGQGEDEAPKATGTNVLWGERRRHRRFRLGVPVNLHIGGRANPVVVEIVDIGARGARFRAETPPLRVEEEAAFGFVSNGQDMQHICVTNGRVLRVGGDGDFVLSVERANAAFHSFLESLAA